MSSGDLGLEDSADFRWRDDLDENDYVFATFSFESHFEPEIAAIAMAKEQSTLVATPGGAEEGEANPLSARLVHVYRLGETNEELLPGYHVDTHAYPRVGEGSASRTIVRGVARIGFPLGLLPGGMAGFWGVVVGELPRLGYLNAVRLDEVDFPARYLSRFAGPRYGVAGLRERLEVFERPLFCRAARPPVGPVEEMAAKGGEVLTAGFDMLKDDENTLSESVESFRARVRSMAAVIREAEAQTGEKKLYIANIVDCTGDFDAYLAASNECGAHGVLVAPGIQGQDVIEQVRGASEQVILAHNNGLDIWTRHPRVGVAPSVLILLQRIAGADLIFLPGEFATASADEYEMARCVAACSRELPGIESCLPIMAGGKRPGELGCYVESVGGGDFMIIASTAVDTHPDGPRAGARAFRDAWQTLCNLAPGKTANRR